jgi:hypothetical protein
MSTIILNRETRENVISAASRRFGVTIYIRLDCSQELPKGQNTNTTAIKQSTDGLPASAS